MAKVVIADDNRFSRRMLCKHVKDIGHDVLEAENGLEALKLIKEHQPDIILTDLLMPEMSGTELLHQLQHDSITIPCIVISADIQSTTRDEVMAAGAKNFLNKPFTAETVAEALQQVLQDSPQ